MRLVRAAFWTLLLSFAPLVIVGTLDPSSNPVGLGLLFLAGSHLAALLLVAAGVRAIWRLVAGGR